MLLSHVSIKSSSSTKKKKAEAVRKLEPYICPQCDEKPHSDSSQSSPEEITSQQGDRANLTS